MDDSEEITSSRLPRQLGPAQKALSRGLKWCGKHLNFFRVHVLIFTFTPLIAAAIFYACNGQTHVKFIDALFVCTSAMTVTGLVSINISTINGGQQAILFFLMCIGNISAVSITMIWIRRHFFRAKFDRIIKTSAKARKKVMDVEEQEKREKRMNLIKLQRIMGLKPTDSKESTDDEALDSSASSSSERAEAKKQAKRKAAKGGKRQPLRAHMIRRVDGPAFLINPAGGASISVPEAQQEDQRRVVESPQSTSILEPSTERSPSGGILNTDRRGSDEGTGSTAQHPSIRIAASNSFLGTGIITDSPDEEIRLSRGLQGSASRRGSLPRFAASDFVAPHEEVIDDDDAEMEADKELQSSSDRPLRTRFPDDVNEGPRTRGRRVSDPPQSKYRCDSDTGLLNVHAAEKHEPFPRAQTVEFAEPRDFRSHESQTYTTGMAPQFSGLSAVRSRVAGGREFDRTTTMRFGASGRQRSGVPLTRTVTSSKQRGFGGFPTPVEIAGMALKKALPRVQERINRTMTMPRTSTIASIHSGNGSIWTDGNTKPAPYLSFDATITGNSRFRELTEAQRDELGGVEYRAIDLLAKIIPAYWLLINLTMVTIVAPYVNSGAFAKYRPNFENQGEHRPGYTWFTFFQMVSAYSNTGMSLIDTSMIGMQDAYFILIPMGFLILVGNTAFPIFLRFFIWCFSIVVPKRSRLYETVRFLLDHPRRCFVYLFPSSQTWFLLMILIFFNVTDWIAFLVLDIGNPTIESIPLPTRIFDGLFQSIAVRSAGFQVVSLLALAPAVQFLCVIMMYLSAFPLALSVRSTNVYEEKSLGVYEPEEPEPGQLPSQNDAKVWGTFLASHARRQLAFDIWWLGFALWLICIIERHNIDNVGTNNWFTVFSCMFELTSAYGTVGLSMGTPTDAFSLSGRFQTLSKLVVIAVMIRGRHRGLPVAIDRAILLPSELDIEDDEISQCPLDEDEDRTSAFLSRIPTSGPGGGSWDNNLSFSKIHNTNSGVSFADGGRRSIGSDGQSPSPISNPGNADSRYSLQLGGLGAPGPKSSNAPMLSAINEVPGLSTPRSESRPESPEVEKNAVLPAYTSGGEQSASGNDTHSGSGSDKGKQKELVSDMSLQTAHLETGNVSTSSELASGHSRESM